MKILFENAFVLAGGSFNKLSLAVEDGIITGLDPNINSTGFDLVIKLDGKYIVPGFADVHVHLRQPGFSYKETIASGTRAAAAGGFTAVCSMPNLNPAPDSVSHIRLQRDLIEQQAVVDVLPYATLTLGRDGKTPVDAAALWPYAVAFTDDGDGVMDDSVMLEIMQRVKAVGGIVAAHCEDKRISDGGVVHSGCYAKEHSLKGIPPESESEQLKRDIELVRRTGCRYHACHISSAQSIELIRAAKAEGLDITCETAPHYLTFCDKDLKDDGSFKMNPPLRCENDRAALIEAVKDGTIDMLATDHAPHTEKEKAGGLKNSLFGIVGLETAFSAAYTALVKPGHITLSRLWQLMCQNPRTRFGLYDNNFKIQRLCDLTVLDIDNTYTVTPYEFASQGKSTPYAGMSLTGYPILTMAKGRLVWMRK